MREQRREEGGEQREGVKEGGWGRQREGDREREGEKEGGEERVVEE